MRMVVAYVVAEVVADGVCGGSCECRCGWRAALRGRDKVSDALRAHLIRRFPVVISAIAVLSVCCAAAGWGGNGLLFLMPALLLGCALLARRYPGERVLLALHSAERVRFPRPRSSVPSRARVIVASVRGGRLLGCSLAVRPPPELPAAS